ncbi:flavodoxin family protein [Pseudorhodoferax sp. Leaf267]|uniref:flavodoxin family protein n=1 Tax=Pseudorhodoferax sp. Leaf267 TaxID=1736316 RepID=UPI0007014FE5|nr:flavodoxin family protein [Pseudorhodoferax sp. Leaf267]KQP13681.1 NADPH-dependent FMN reductase [Pseudorhodoferax sp. Leaf267]
MTHVRTGQAPAPLDRQTFHLRFVRRFSDPAYASVQDAIAQIEDVAWDAYHQGRKAPITRPAGPGFADPAYDTSVEWLETRERLQQAQKTWADPATPSRVLLVCASARNDGTCPGEMSKTWRMTQMARAVVEAQGMQADVLDLSLVTSEYGKAIHPCKGCVGTAMPLCHWPCSCYPNHAMDQANDWMAEIYERWVAAHGVILLTPTYWYQSTSPLKLMIDRMVCADGGNPDVTSTHGKKAAEAKAIEEAGWDFPKHLAGRAYGLVVHGDVAGVEVHRRNLADWLNWMGLLDAGHASQLDRYIGYYEPYYDSHDTLDADEDVQAEVRQVAEVVVAAVRAVRAGTLRPAKTQPRLVRPK